MSAHHPRPLCAPLDATALEVVLGRNPIRLEETSIRAALASQVVLVTGAAGSVGSELCRQIARFRPAVIVGLDIAESPLVESELDMRAATVPFRIEVGNVQNRARVEEIFREYSPSVVFHAAAYKHVPLMERQIFEAVENNVFGTDNVASAALEYGAREFVLVSSDKAVRPASVMGATKRVAELLVSAMPAATKFVAVRFGNVLDSNGSVLRVFRKQIASGGPVTVTHPDMRRFFMTLPEACQLVLQASAVCENGQICALDMGEPVRIVDLAKKLISLAGLEPGRDIRIEVTGIRPGEKLHEEIGDLIENTRPTAHEKIRVFSGHHAPPALSCWLDRLRVICAARDAEQLVLALRELVPDYTPTDFVLDRASIAD